VAKGLTFSYLYLVMLFTPILKSLYHQVPDVEWIEGQPTHRWRVDEENMGIELSFEKSIRGAATAPDALIEWIAKKLFPEIMRQVDTSAFISCSSLELINN
jgi:hypothetical protein